MDNKYKHLNMIEKVIERMSRNSFALKGWTLTLIVLIGSFSAVGMNQKYIIIAFLPIICFWFLDSFYLCQERKYRALYKNVQKRDESEIDFSLDVGDIENKEENTNKIRYHKCFFSITEIVFYLPVIVGTIILVVILFCLA